MYKKRSFHGLTRNGETVLYTFLASGRSRNPTTYRKNSSLRQYLTASSCHHYAIADYSHLFSEIAGICTRTHLRVPVENIKEI